MLGCLLSRPTLLTTGFATGAFVGTGADFFLGLLFFAAAIGITSFTTSHDLSGMPAGHRNANRWRTSKVVPWGMNRMHAETDDCRRIITT